jgi:tetratricopeptide (TPR) repeat protein
MDCTFTTRVKAGLIGFAVVCSFALAGYAQVPDPSATATIYGSVRDVRGAAVAGVSVFLQTENAAAVQTVSTDSQGDYRFANVSAGTYTLRAKAKEYEEASTGSFTVGNEEKKTIDLVMKPIAAASQGISPAAMPEFSDGPNFTVAGVSDTTNLGGHGSDVVVRNREGLAKATASLGNEPASSAQPSASLAAKEKVLRAEIERNSTNPNSANVKTENYEANYRLGELLVEEGKAREAIPYLERASQINGGGYEGEYELALAHCAAGDYEIAAAQSRALLVRQDKAAVHHLLAEVEEKRNDPLEAVRQYQRAAELEGSEANYFDWGAELLLHQAPEPAVEVFSKGSRLFPASVRLLSALGAAWYARGSYDHAVETLCRASDLDPKAEGPYLFLGRIQNVEAGGSREIADRMARFARQHPANAWANYYYAVSLWKRREGPEDQKDLLQIETLLREAVRLDPKLGAAYLQLGILYSEQKKSSAAVAAYQKAVESAPDLPDAHYRLAQAYRQAGEKLRAQQQLQLYQQTSQREAEQVERQRHEVRQFVYTLREQSPPPLPN